MRKKSIFTNMLFVTLAALLCCALWGSATPFIKIGYELLLPEKNVPSTILFAGIRFTMAGIITILIYSIGRRKFIFPQKENWDKVAKIAAVQTVIQYIFFYIGLANTTGAKGTIISGSDVFSSLLIAALLYKQEKLTPKKVIGCLVGFCGIILVNLDGLDFKMNFMGDCFVLFSAISYSFSSVFVKKFSQYEDPVILSGYQFLLGGIFMIIVGLIFGGVVTISGGAALAVLIYLSFLSAIAYALWGILLKHNPVSRVSIFSFTKPVFGVLLSAILLNEQSGVSVMNLIISLVLVCAGILILNIKKED